MCKKNEGSVGDIEREEMENRFLAVPSKSEMDKDGLGKGQ